MPANTRNPTQRQSQAGRRFHPAGRVSPARTKPNFPPKLRSRPNLALVVGHIYLNEYMFVVSQNKRRSKADNQTDKNCMLQYSSLSAKENLYCSTAPPIYFQSILQACIIIIIRLRLVTVVV